jgi:hypothetical protein
MLLRAAQCGVAADVRVRCVAVYRQLGFTASSCLPDPSSAACVVFLLQESWQTS